MYINSWGLKQEAHFINLKQFVLMHYNLTDFDILVFKLFNPPLILLLLNITIICDILGLLIFIFYF